MAKSLRSKVKRSFRAKKRTEGIYAATQAARLNRLNARLIAVASKVTDNEIDDEAEPMGAGDDDIPDDEQEGGLPSASNEASMALDVPTSSDKKDKISTHGPRGSRREDWRLSKGMSARPHSKGTNRQGGIAAKRKAGRPKRRR